MTGHTYSAEKDDTGLIHARCACGWRGQSRSPKTAQTLWELHVYRVANPPEPPPKTARKRG